MPRLAMKTRAKVATDVSVRMLLSLGSRLQSARRVVLRPRRHIETTFFN